MWGQPSDVLGQSSPPWGPNQQPPPAMCLQLGIRPLPALLSLPEPTKGDRNLVHLQG